MKPIIFLFISLLQFSQKLTLTTKHNKLLKGNGNINFTNRIKKMRLILSNENDTPSPKNNEKLNTNPVLQINNEKLNTNPVLQINVEQLNELDFSAKIKELWIDLQNKEKFYGNFSLKNITEMFFSKIDKIVSINLQDFKNYHEFLDIKMQIKAQSFPNNFTFDSDLQNKMFNINDPFSLTDSILHFNNLLESIQLTNFNKLNFIYFRNLKNELQKTNKNLECINYELDKFVSLIVFYVSIYEECLVKDNLFTLLKSQKMEYLFYFSKKCKIFSVKYVLEKKLNTFQIKKYYFLLKIMLGRAMYFTQRVLFIRFKIKHPLLKYTKEDCLFYLKEKIYQKVLLSLVYLFIDEIDESKVLKLEVIILVEEMKFMRLMAVCLYCDCIDEEIRVSESDLEILDEIDLIKNQ